MADHVPSQARFMGGLALAMIALAALSAILVFVAVSTAPPV